MWAVNKFAVAVLTVGLLHCYKDNWDSLWNGNKLLTVQNWMNKKYESTNMLCCIIILSEYHDILYINTYHIHYWYQSGIFDYQQEL